MTDDPATHQPVLSWGRGVLEPKRAHVRETHDGVPVADEVDGAMVGFAICGCLLIADLDPDAAGVARCSVCTELLSRPTSGASP